MARVWQSGFETNSVGTSNGEWGSVGGSAGDFSIVTSPVRTGTYAGKITSSASGAQLPSIAGFNLSSGYARTYFQFSGTAPGAQLTIFRFTKSGGSIASLALTASGTLRIDNNVGGGGNATGTTALSADTWYRLELKLVVSATVGIIEVKLDGAVEATLSSLDTGTVNIDGVMIGPGDTFTGTTALYYDDLALDDAAYPGAGSIIQLVPNGDGTLNSWTSDGASPHYDSADDWPGTVDDDTTYLYAPNKTDATGYFDLTSTSTTFDAGAVNAIMALIRTRKEETVGGGSAPTIPTVAAGRVLTTVQADTSGTRTFPNLSSLTKNSGDLLIAIITAYQSSTTDAQFSSWGGGFTEIHDTGTSSTMAVGVAYKFSTGSETGTFDVTQAATITGHAAMILLSIPGAHASTPPEAGSRASGTASAADPGAFDPSGWGAENTLWIAVGGSGETGTGGAFTGLASAPTSYTDYVDTGISADVVGGTEGAVSFRQLNASSEDVGTYSVDTSNARNAAVVIAVRPAADTADTVDLYAQLFRSDESTAITTETTIVTTTPTSYTTYLKLMTGTGSHTKANWDAARVALRQDYTVQGSADTDSRLRVTAVALSVDFVPANPSLVIGAGSYSLSGTAAGLLSGRKLVIGGGSYVLTGTATTLSRTRALVIGAGAYSLVGTSLNLLADRVLSIGAGSYSLTGSTVGLFKGRSLIVDSGSYTLTGTAATLLATRVIVPASGTYNLTGTAASLLAGRRLSIGSGVYAISGTSAGVLVARKLSSAAGSYVLTGADATLLKSGGSIVFSVDSGVYLITGTDATLTSSGEQAVVVLYYPTWRPRRRMTC